MKYFSGQRVRIRSDARPAYDVLEHLKGEIFHIVAPYRDRYTVEQPWYELDAKAKGCPVVAAESALEPVFEPPQKISWQHSSVVWRPKFMDAPAVIRRNRTTPA